MKTCLRTGIRRQHGGNLRQPTKLVDVKPVTAAEAGRCLYSRRVPSCFAARIGTDGTISDLQPTRAVNPDLELGRPNAIRQWGVHADAADCGAVEVPMTVRVSSDSLTGIAAMLIVRLTFGWTLVGRSVAESSLYSPVSPRGSGRRPPLATIARAISVMVHYPLQVARKRVGSFRWTSCHVHPVLVDARGPGLARVWTGRVPRCGVTT